jgi:hypothetical protein
MKNYCTTHERDHERMSGSLRCRECHRAACRRWKKKTGYKPKVSPAQQRRYNDKRCYGLDGDESDRLRAIEQCQVCGSTGSMVIDHCHDSGVVRGVLCTPCNLALGHVKDSPDTLRALASYLER